MNDEEEDLNRRAYLAMSRINPHVERRLVELLRSDVPIQRYVRNAIADALEGKNANDRITLKVDDKTLGPLGDFATKRDKFHRDMAIARFVAGLRPQLSREKALEAASNQFNESEALCDKALKKASDWAEWVEKYYPERPSLWANVTDEQYRHLLEVEYFTLMRAGRLSDGNRFT